MLKTNTKF